MNEPTAAVPRERAIDLLRAGEDKYQWALGFVARGEEKAKRLWIAVDAMEEMHDAMLALAQLVGDGLYEEALRRA